VYDFWPSDGPIFSKNALFGRKSGFRYLKKGILGRKIVHKFDFVAKMAQNFIKVLLDNS